LGWKKFNQKRDKCRGSQRKIIYKGLGGGWGKGRRAKISAISHDLHISYTESSGEVTNKRREKYVLYCVLYFSLV